MSLWNIVQFIVFCICLYLSMLALFFFFADKLLYVPDKQDFQKCSLVQSVSGEVKEVEFEGEKLRYYLQQKVGAKALIVLFHGNAGSACDRANYLTELKDFPVNIVLAEYPGYSNGKQKISETKIKENAKKLFKHLKSQANMSLPIILYGESLGCGPAIYLASLTDAKALILQTPYTSIQDMAKLHYPYLPVKLILRDTFLAKEWAQNVNQKVLILHGTDDSVIPLNNSRELVNYFPFKPQFEVFEGYGHNDINSNNKQYWSKVKDFIKESF